MSSDQRLITIPYPSADYSHHLQKSRKTPEQLATGEYNAAGDSEIKAPKMINRLTEAEAINNQGPTATP